MKYDKPLLLYYFMYKNVLYLHHIIYQASKLFQNIFELFYFFLPFFLLPNSSLLSLIILPALSL